MALAIDDNHQRPQVLVLLPNPSELHAVEDAQVHLVISKLLGQHVGVLRQLKLTVERGLALHQRLHGAER